MSNINDAYKRELSKSKSKRNFNTLINSAEQSIKQRTSSSFHKNRDNLSNSKKNSNVNNNYNSFADSFPLNIPTIENSTINKKNSFNENRRYTENNNNIVNNLSENFDLNKLDQFLSIKRMEMPEQYNENYIAFIKKYFKLVSNENNNNFNNNFNNNYNSNNFNENINEIENPIYKIIDQKQMFNLNLNQNKKSFRDPNKQKIDFNNKVNNYNNMRIFNQNYFKGQNNQNIGYGVQNYYQN